MLPADLLRRRPDILVAEARLAHAAVNVGVERADLYPSLIIPGRIAVDKLSPGSVFGPLFAVIGASLNLPIFDGGRRRAEVRAAQGEADARFAEYRRALLEVYARVETALVAIQSYRERIDSLENAIAQSQAAFRQSNALYREGFVSLFDVFDVQRQLIASRESLIAARAQLAGAIIDFYAAVGARAGSDDAVLTTSARYVG